MGRHRAAAEGVVPLQVSVGVGELRRVVAVGRGRPAAVEGRDPLGVVVVGARRRGEEVEGRVRREGEGEGRGRRLAGVEARDPLGVVVGVEHRQEGEAVGRGPLGEVVAEERQRRRVEAL